MADNSLPWEDAQATHAQLYQARYNAKTQEEQNAIAPLEHRAFAREAVTENPLMAVPIAAAIPIYQGAKVLGLTNSRSEASVAQVTEGFKGIGEGIANAVAPPWEEAKKLAGTVVSSIKEGINTAKQLMPWEQAQQAASSKVPVQPSLLQPTQTTSLSGVFKQLVQAESQGKHTDASGNLLTSSAGAQGITQLLPATAKKPGFGIEGVRDKSESEYLRVGKEYLTALTDKYNGDHAKALAAYNAGLGNVDKAIEKAKTKGGKWFDYLPKKSETIPYINKILGTNFASNS
jgi:soluble lytic murein transglycosylase-like protein